MINPWNFLNTEITEWNQSVILETLYITGWSEKKGQIGNYC